MGIRRHLASGYGGLQSTSDAPHSSSDGLQPTSNDTRSEAITFPRSEAIVFLRSEATASPESIQLYPNLLSTMSIET